jgi:hypothetical protein
MSTPVSSRNKSKADKSILLDFDTFDKENTRPNEIQFFKKKKESKNCFRAGSGESGSGNATGRGDELELLRHKILFLQDQNKELQSENLILKKKVMKVNKKLKNNNEMIGVLRSEIIEVHNENKMLVDEKIQRINSDAQVVVNETQQTLMTN